MDLPLFAFADLSPIDAWTGIADRVEGGTPGLFKLVVRWIGLA